MHTLELNHDRGATPHWIGAGLAADAALWRRILTGRVLIVTDANVAALHLDRVVAAMTEFAPETLVLEPGEPAKTASAWLAIVERLAEIGAQRDATVVALGGGVVGDLAGFAAASYMRGIRVVQAPTTLLAQVDAAIGGKTGFNLAAGKNLVGAFHQPAAVVIDVELLATLDAREYRAGLAEVVKYGCIRSSAMLNRLGSRVDALNARQPGTLADIVAESVRHKVEVVEADEREAGQRALLNFGHTFGHALETATGYRRFLHGEAVAIGMCLAARFSAALGLLPTDAAERLERLLEALGLPTAAPDDIAAGRLIELMQLDKKNRAGRLRLVLLEAEGRAVVRDDIESATVQEFLES